MEKIKREVKKETKAVKKLTGQLRKANINSGKTRRRKPRGKTRNHQFPGISKFDKFVNPVQFRKLASTDVVPSMRAYGRVMKDRYLAGLAHPDIAVSHQIPVKAYSDVPIPTAAIGFKDQFQFTTSSNGTFLLSWRPQAFWSSTVLSASSLNAFSKITFNNSAGLTGQVLVNGNNFVAGHYAPSISVQRYRLVSALLRVTYNGSVLNQAGTMTTCCTFDPFPVAVGTVATPITTHSDGLVDRFGNFSIIRNGLWNQTENITQGDHGVENLFVPMDPDDLIFERDGVYRGGTRTTSGVVNPVTEGAPISYVVAGSNLPASSSCILAEVFYNYEVVADPESAPILRASTDNHLSAKENREIKDSISDMIAQSGLTRPAKQWSFSDVLGNVAKFGLKYMPELLAMF